MKTEYLTMWEASKVCSYSQEYLSLLSRRQLLKAVKKENKWLTTTQWLAEYLADKKPDEVIVSRKKAAQLLGEKREGVWREYAAIALAAFSVLIVAAAVFTQMSNKISALEAENNAVSRARADVMAGFDSSVLETLDAESPPVLGSQSSQ